MMNQGFQKMDLVTREEFELQTKVLAKTREKLEILEAKVAALEKQKINLVLFSSDYSGEKSLKKFSYSSLDKKVFVLSVLLPACSTEI